MRAARSAEAKRRPGARAATARASVDQVDVAQRGQQTHRQAVLLEPGELRAQVSAAAHRHADEQRRAAAPQADRPVAAVGAPGPAPRRCRRVMRRARPRRARRVAAAACPCRPAAPGPPTSANAAARRSSRPCAALRDDLEPARQPRTGLAVEHEHPAAGRRRRCTRVERVRAARPRPARAACAGCSGGHSRVFDPPGQRAPWRSRSARRSREHPRPCHGPPAAVPRTRAGDLRAPRRAGGRSRAPRRSASRRRRRAAPSPAASRSGGRAMPEVEQRARGVPRASARDR